MICRFAEAGEPYLISLVALNARPGQVLVSSAEGTNWKKETFFSFHVLLLVARSRRGITRTTSRQLASSTSNVCPHGVPAQPLGLLASVKEVKGKKI